MNERQGICPDCGSRLRSGKTVCKCGWSEVHGSPPGSDGYCPVPNCRAAASHNSTGTWRCFVHDRDPRATQPQLMPPPFQKVKTAVDVAFDLEMKRFARQEDEPRSDYLTRLKVAMKDMLQGGTLSQSMAMPGSPGRPRYSSGRVNAETMKEALRQLAIQKETARLAAEMGHDGEREPGADDDL